MKVIIFFLSSLIPSPLKHSDKSSPASFFQDSSPTVVHSPHHSKIRMNLLKVRGAPSVLPLTLYNLAGHILSHQRFCVVVYRCTRDGKAREHMRGECVSSVFPHANSIAYHIVAIRYQDHTR